MTRKFPPLFGSHSISSFSAYNPHSMNLQVLQRVCGGCTVCCTTCAVGEINKPTQTACQHLHETGCKIYEDRPTACRHYNCLWLEGLLPEQFRPDRSGVAISRDASNPARFHVYLTRSDIPFERVEYLFSKFPKRPGLRYEAHIFPPQFVSPEGAPFQIRKIKEGFYMAEVPSSK